MRRRILIVDDEPNIIELIRMNLPESEFEILAAWEGRTALETAQRERPDLILLDIMLPDLDGFEVLRILRGAPETAAIPVMMLTARSEEPDKVIGLGLGAEDYITKPFGLRELEARIRNALRRSGVSSTSSSRVGPAFGSERAPADQLGASRDLLRVKDLVIDIERHEVVRKNVVSDLTPNEFAILRRLATQQGQVVSRRELLSVISGDRDEADPRVIDVHIRNLRRKLDDQNETSRYIETVRGMGYRMKKAQE